MAKKATLAMKDVDGLLKALLVLSRTATYVLEGQAVDSVASEPLSSSKIQILRLLGQRGGQTSTKVAKFLGVSKPAVSQIIDAMVASKMVTRKTASVDRREVNLQLTKKGTGLFQAIRKQQRQYMRSALGAGPKSRTGTWETVLQEVSQALAQADDAYEKFCAQCGAHPDDTCVLVGGDAECIFLQKRPRASKRAKAAAAARR